MIRHIVLWRLKSADEAIVRRIRRTLESQVGCIPCDFEGREALAAYHRHPVHMETRAIVDPLVAEHWIADYEV